MRACHLFENAIYVISNHAVARNPIFTDKAYCVRFLQKANKYLSPICEIMQYSLDQNQFHFLVKLKSRAIFCSHYRKKNKNAELPVEKIPHETYIFSQAMANLQSSTAIHFNRKEKRTGALFARRYYKHLVESEGELQQWVERFREFYRHMRYSTKWVAREVVKDRERWVKKNRGMNVRNGTFYYKNKILMHPILDTFKRIYNMKLQGQFDFLPPRQLRASFSLISFQIKPFPPP
jgi:hypothetical protein